VRSLAEKVHPPTVRAAVLGADREGRRYLQLQAAPLLAGERAAASASANMCECTSLLAVQGSFMRLREGQE
jgi:hypothetical protein